MTMTVDDIRTLYDFNRWANGEIVAALRPCPAGDLGRDMQTSHGSILGTLVHVMWSEWIWLRRWLGESPKRVVAVDEFSGLDAVVAAWDKIESERAEFVARLTESDLAARISYENLRGETWTYSLAHMMQHVVNHSSYHRGQIVALLRQIGSVPPATDFLVYIDVRDGR
jgi:uncharacterized damage-inducible protein DinB